MTIKPLTFKVGLAVWKETETIISKVLGVELISVREGFTVRLQNFGYSAALNWNYNLHRWHLTWVQDPRAGI